jgi:asparagine synthase (glutamine-hydrolysing)
MCGIAGIVAFDDPGLAQGSIVRMTRQQRHRGPDGQGILRRQGVALGHRRLSIIDVAGGHQPMANETHDVWLTFNGEIYNYQELRRTLIASGHVFRTDSDSEVIVHAYEQWGEGCVQHLRGMFAFGIADFRQQKLFLARDHFGIKPLYYRVEPDFLAFASELAPLVDLGAACPEINPQGIDYYLRYRYIPAPQTIYERILRLPPAHTWSCRFDGRAAVPREYWRLQFEPAEQVDDDEWLDGFAAVLDESVAAHLVADVPFGALLSGGVDSTLVVAAMARQLKGDVQVFSIGFDDQSYSELEHARHAAGVLGVELHTQVVRPDVVGILDELFANFGEPFADTSAIPTWCVSQLARQHVTMVLSGDGADEAFAGYGRYDAFVRDTVSRDLLDLVRRPGRAVRRLAARLLGAWPDRLQRWQQRYVGVFDDQARARLWRPEYRSLVHAPCSAFSSAHRDGCRLPTLEYAQYLDLNTYLPGDILTKVDVASMCHGLEVRTPFIDRRVMEFAATLPSRWRRARRNWRPATLKPLPKQYLARQFPASFVHRRKQGFAIPEADWLRPGSLIRQRLDQLLHDPASGVYEYFDPQRTRQLVAEFDQTGRQATSLWLLMILGMWMEQRAASRQPVMAA